MDSHQQPRRVAGAGADTLFPEQTARESPPGPGRQKLQPLIGPPPGQWICYAAGYRRSALDPAMVDGAGTALQTNHRVSLVDVKRHFFVSKAGAALSNRQALKDLRVVAATHPCRRGLALVLR